MDEGRLTPERFQAERGRLRAVAYRMLGSLSEAEDAVQETWLRASQADLGPVENLTAWLTTVTGRVCLNLLRSRRTRREEPLDEQPAIPVDGSGHGADPEQEAMLADSVGIALLVVLDALSPTERVAFVLHDLFQVPFDEIAPLIERTPAATRQLASRARRRVRGTTAPAGDLSRRRKIVEAFLAASRAGDFQALISLLHPDAVLTADRFVVPTPEPIVLQGAHQVAESATAAAGRARLAGPALLDGEVGLAMVWHGRLGLVLTFDFSEEGISRIDVIADRERLARIDLAVLPG
ncbi:sigma-70 family RNA polymerase sigma factor [Streptomyces hoynatensis]|uniref:Sigma-70 family RNA polymerase sigma factor n=1 Tax=Streptomyces hoynatensis TaxID=1141874 RepID=A0A3A9Z6P8_9ACTN|nr:sigma-70 family RNA polymerase sigma factor [Streptomyces hoynatensis]RKN43900.1 sigma-70 family RNA polymerase sigma factor [Streptomyces hoynatensis]